MSESVRDLVVTLSLNQGDFDRNLRSVAAAIRQAESEFRLAAAGTKSFDTSLTGLAAKHTELSQKINLQTLAVQQYEGKLRTANATLSATQGYLEQYSAKLQAAKSSLALLENQIQYAQSTTIVANARMNATQQALNANRAAIAGVTGALQQNRAELAQAEILYEETTAIFGENSIQAQAAEAEMYRLAQSDGQLRTQLQGLNTEQARLTALLQQQTAAAQEAATREQEMKDKATQLRDEIKKLEEQVKAEERALQNNKTKVADLTAKLNDARAKLKAMEEEMRRNELEAARLSSAWTRAGTALTTFGNMATKVGRSMARTGRMMTTYITTPLIALGTYAVKSAISYEAAFAYVRKTVKATAEEYQELSDAIVDMSTRYARSADEIAQVVATAGQLGIANEHLLTFSKTMIDISNTAADIDAETAATTLAKFANIMGSNQGDFARMGSTLIELGNNFATTEAPIMEMSLRLAGAGKQIGLTEAQVMGVATALSSLGLEAQMGGSAMSKALIKMEVAANTGGKDLEGFAQVCGMTAAQFKSAWGNDPIQVFQAFINGLAAMDEEGISAIAVLNEIGIKELRLRDVMLRATNNTTLFARAQAMANSAWARNTTLQVEADKRYGTTASKLANLKNKATEAARQIGDDLNPMLQDLMKEAERLIAGFMGMDEAQRGNIERWAMIAAAAGPCLLIFGRLLTGVGGLAKALGSGLSMLGKFSAAVTVAGGGAKGFLKVVGGLSTGAKLGIGLAITAAIIAGTVALVDYATGAKRAREAIEGMNRTAQDFKNNAASTFFQRDGLGQLGLTTDVFAVQKKSADTFFNNMRTGWSSTKRKSSETVQYWQNGWHALTNDTREGMLTLQETARGMGYGVLSDSISEDMKALDKIDKEYDRILKNARNRDFTEKELDRLQQLINQRQAIVIKYRLEEESTDTGFDAIDRALEDVKRRAEILGVDAPDTAYEDAAVAYMQGWSSYSEKLNAQFDTDWASQQNIIDTTNRMIEANDARIAEISGKERQSNAEKQELKRLQKQNAQLVQERDAAIAMQEVLKTQYQQDWNAGAERYQEGLLPILNEVVKGGDFQETLSGLETLWGLIQRYEQAENDQERSGVLAEIEDFTAGMDEGKWTQMFSVLSMIYSFGDEEFIGGLPNADSIQRAIGMYAGLAAYFKNGGKTFGGLNTIFGDAIPEEVAAIFGNYGITPMQEVWEGFGDNGNYQLEAEVKATKITVDENTDTSDLDNLTAEASITGFINGYAEEDGPIDFTDSLSVTAAVERYVASKGIDIRNLTPTGITAIVSAFVPETNPSIISPTVEALISRYGITEATDRSALENLTAEATITKFVNGLTDEEGAPVVLTGAELSSEVTVAALVTSYVESANVDKSQLKPGDIEAIVTSFVAATGATINAGAVTDMVCTSLNITATTVNAPAVTVDGVLRLTAIDRSAISQTESGTGSKTNAYTRYGNLAPEDQELLENSGADIWQNGINVTVNFDYDQLKPSDLILFDADGKVHVAIVPEIVGDEESLKDAQYDLTASGLFVPSSMDKVNEKLNNLGFFELNGQQYWSHADAVQGNPLAAMWLWGAKNLNGTFGFNDNEAVEILRFMGEATKLMLGGGALDEKQLEDYRRIAALSKIYGEYGEGETFRQGLMSVLQEAGLDVDMDNMDATVDSLIASASEVTIENANTAEQQRAAEIAERQRQRDLDDFFRNGSGGMGLVEDMLRQYGSAGPDMGTWNSMLSVYGLPQVSWEDALDRSGLQTEMDQLQDDAASGGAEVGSNLAGGVAAAMTTFNFGPSAQTTMDHLLTAMRQAGMIASPSRLFKREVGVYLAQGIAVGFQEETKQQSRIFANAVRHMADVAYSGVENVNNNQTRNETYNATNTLHVDTMVMQGEMDAEALMEQMNYFQKRAMAGYGS